ncbi:MAG: phosphate ABC transporter ATP-binding protein [Dethiobacter sp.]|jgi:tungstate transport system ATP-binding protein|nr:phosphate ABC transporter ATP-binding protein [Dethiobacter sp.]
MNNTNTEIIAISGLIKKYGSKEVLRVDKLNVRRGSITGIIGPSGAGKTTFLRILNLLDTPTKGELCYFGRPVPSAPEAKLTLQRRMMMVFQKPALFDMSVSDNVAFGMRARGFSARETEERSQSVLKKVGLESQGRQRAKTLSGGEAQRVALARALVLEPEILLLDEPTANLDPANVELLESMITFLNSEYKTTVLIVTHNLFQARRLSTELLFLYQGRLVEEGTAHRIFQSPRHEETRSFIEGRMIY